MKRVIDHLLGQVIQHFHATRRASNVALQVAIVCCPYYHHLAQQTFIRRERGNTVNKQLQLTTRHLFRDKLQENVARVTWPLPENYRQLCWT